MRAAALRGTRDELAGYGGWLGQFVADVEFQIAPIGILVDDRAIPPACAHERYAAGRSGIRRRQAQVDRVHAGGVTVGFTACC
jgi:hypothetical protein